MKSLLRFWWLFPVVAVAGGITPAFLSSINVPVAASSCSINTSNNAASAYYLGSASYRYYASTRHAFTDGNHSVCAIAVKLTCPGGNISGKTFNVAIWATSGNNLGTLQGTSAGILGTNTWNETWVKFDFSPAVSVTDDTEYFYTITHNSVDGDNLAQYYYATLSGYAWSEHSSDGVNQGLTPDSTMGMVWYFE